MVLRVACVVLGLLVASAARADSAPTVNVTVHMQGQDAAPTLVSSGPIGSTNPTITKITVNDGGGGKLDVDVTVHVQITLNKEKLKNKYTVPESDDDECSGLPIKPEDMQKYATDHERKHVDQIENALKTALDGNATYNKASNSFTVGHSSGNPNVNFSGADPAQNPILKAVESSMQGQLDGLAKQDADDYANRSGGNGDVEGPARQASCDQYLKDKLEHLAQHPAQATDESNKAKDAAAAAKKAAADALAAAQKCDKVAYQKAADEYAKQKKAAEAHQKEAKALLDGMRDELNELKSQLKKRADKIAARGHRKTPREAAEETRRAALKAQIEDLQAKADELEKTITADNTQIKNDLDAAAKDLAAAKDALAKCAEDEKKKQEENKKEKGGGGGGCGGGQLRDWHAQLRLGGSIGLRGRDSQGSVGVVGERAVSPDRCVLVRVSLQTLFGGGSTVVMLGAGAEYDLRLPVAGLFVTFALDLGYAAAIFSPAGGGTFTDHEGFVQPEIGVKWVFKQRFEVGAVPISLPIFFNGNAVALSYQLLAVGGVAF